MCFKNLPVEFDESGRATLKGGIPNPYAPTEARPIGAPAQLTQEKVEELLKRNGYLQDVDFAPVTRVAGALAFHSVVDMKERRVVEARSMATLFRGYEVIMVGRDPRDAIFITSRACGVCGGVHSATSAMATEMAIGACPPRLGVLIRNLALALEFLYDHPLHLHLLAGPDYSAAMVGPTNPSLLDKAKTFDAPGAAIHGYRTMVDLMTDLNPLTGHLYVEALHMTRVAREVGRAGRDHHRGQRPGTAGPGRGGAVAGHPPARREGQAAPARRTGRSGILDRRSSRRARDGVSTGRRRDIPAGSAAREIPRNPGRARDARAARLVARARGTLRGGVIDCRATGVTTVTTAGTSG